MMASRSSYFEQLGNDLFGLGILSNTPGTDPNLNQVTSMLQATANCEQIPSNTCYEPETELAEKLLRMKKAGVRFDEDFGVSDYACCPLAELRLIRALSSDFVLDSTTYSPTIVVDQGKPIAVVKQLVECTAYGLVDKPKIGLFAGMYANYSNPHYDPMNNPTHGQATVRTLGRYDWFSPLRFGAFVTPAAARQQAADAAEKPYLLPLETHDEIVQKVRQLLDSAGMIQRWPG